MATTVATPTDVAKVRNALDATTAKVTTLEAKVAGLEEKVQLLTGGTATQEVD